MKKVWIVMILLLMIGACIYVVQSMKNTDVSHEQDTDSNPMNPVDAIEIIKLDALATGTWQAEVRFPDWKGYIDDTLAMNSMYSFDGAKDQGKLYVTVPNAIESFDLFVNNKKMNTATMRNGIFEVDISSIVKNGTNTIQVSDVQSKNREAKVTVNIPYPRVMEGTVEEVGLSRQSFDLISQIIEADVSNGFASAQLAVVKDGKMVYQNAWGNVNAYHPDGTWMTDGTKVTNDTLYDLASVTKMYSVAYAMQYLIDKGKISWNDKIVDILGKEFVDDTIEIKFASYGGNYPGLNQIKKWKSNITVLDVLMHQAGFPDSGHYHNQKYDTANQKLTDEVDNVLFVADANREKTLKEGIYKTPLIYEPRTKTSYSDIDYMLLGMVIEKITGKGLDTFLSETFWQPMGLTHITYQPLENGFSKEDCAATELNGNTRDGLVDFPHVRKDTIQGEVHDEEAYYMMEGISGHAGLFSNATDLAKLASVMLTGGYDNHRFFSKNIRDIFISPQANGSINYGIGWWREADDNRVWYFGTQAPESSIGHQGWTGTFTMIDFENHMVIVYLTNSINTPIVDTSSLNTANDFAGRYYTSATIGFVPQIIYTGLETNEEDLKEALNALINDMAKEKQKNIENKEAKNGRVFKEIHPLIKAKKAINSVAMQW